MVSRPPRHQPRSHLCLRQRNREHAATRRIPAISLPRSATRRAPSSRSAPALNCRRDPPTLRPITASGRTETAPHRRQPDRHRKQHRPHHVDPIQRRHFSPSSRPARRAQTSRYAGTAQRRKPRSHPRNRGLREQRTPIEATAPRPGNTNTTPPSSRAVPSTPPDAPRLRQRIERLPRLPDIIGMDRSTRSKCVRFTAAVRITAARSACGCDRSHSDHRPACERSAASSADTTSGTEQSAAP